MPKKAIDVTSISQWKELLQTGTPAVGFFWADWHEPSKPGGQMDTVFAHLANLHPGVACLRVEAEAVPEVSVLFNIAVVPTFIFLRGGPEKVVDKLEGAHPAVLVKKIQALTSAAASLPTSTSSSVPSNAAAAAAGGSIASSNDSSDANLEDRLRRLINAGQVVLFMKGSPNEPKCGFSSKIVALLKEEGISFASFDILQDQAVRQGLKTFSNWPTFPQLYVNGELVGGLDIVNELKAEGPLKEQLGIKTEPGNAGGGAGVATTVTENDTASSFSSSSGLSLNDRLKALINLSPVILFMKGTPDNPKCGFSSKIVSLLKEEGFTSLDTFDILTDNEVREGLKKYSSWPTYPQLYIDGELIGGLDIVSEMRQNGELAAFKR